VCLYVPDKVCVTFEPMVGAPELIVGLLVLGLVVGALFVAMRGVRAVVSAGAPAGPNTLPCPDCRKTVSRQAPACPHCGAPRVAV
jgi:hypothetical protein